MFRKLIVLVPFLLLGCASLTQQGYNALEAGQYEKALTLFQQATSESPQNGDALEGLRKAQQEWINRKLIDVRLLRLGDNLRDSETLLLDIIKKENEWQVFPSGVAFSTQKEEILHFSKRVEDRIEKLIHEKNPIAAQVEFNKNHFIMGEARSKNLSLLKNKIYSQGLRFCSETHKGLQSSEYYTMDWLKRTCSIWEVSLKDKPLKNSVVLFKGATPKFSLTHLDKGLQDLLSHDIQTAFLQSKWYDKKGTANLDLSIQGDFEKNYKETPVSRMAVYTVQVPYKDTYKRVKTQKKSNADSILTMLTLLSGNSSMSDEVVRDNMDGTESVTVTKYRAEDRKHYYQATEVSAEKTLKGKIQATLDKQGFEFDFQRKYSLLKDRSNENFPDAGLTPTNPVVLSDADWIGSISKEIVSEVSDQLQKSWLERFCEATTKQALSERELHHRCAFQVTSSIPESLNQYYLKTWQISFLDWQNLTRKSEKE